MSIGVIADSYVAAVSGNPAYQSAVLADAPLAYYRLGETGSIAADSSGNGRSGTYNTGGGETQAVTGLLTGDPDKALLLAGGTTRSGVVVPYAAWQSPLTFTYEAIFEPTTIPSSLYNEVIAHRNSGVTMQGNQYRMSMGWHDSQVNFFVDFVAGGYLDVASAGPTLVAGQRYHFALTYDKVNLKVYLNGAEVYSMARTEDPTDGAATSLRIGNEEYLSGNYGNADGVLDEVAIYGTALSAARIAAHYAAM